MKKFIAFLGVVLLVVVAFGVGGIIATQQDEESIFSDLLNNSVNAALDSTGVKDKIENALYDNVDAISKKTGIPSSQVKKVIDDLDVSNWKATSVPSSASATSTNTVDYNGTSAKVTTYDDPSIVTIETGGVPVTFEVPSSAQGNLSYLKYL